MSYFNSPVGYLENHDFDKSGNLVNPKFKNRPVFVMIFADWCSICHTVKPEFRKFANEYITDTAAIQDDGERESEKILAKRISDIYPDTFSGYPSFMLILPSGEKIPYNGPRTAEGFAQFANEYM